MSEPDRIRRRAPQRWQKRPAGLWGAPQREYITGPELRMRLDLKLMPDLQLMVIERQLMDALERIVFEA